MLHVVITGGAGFIGSHLCERYLADGHRVTAVDNLATGNIANLASFADEPRFSYINADVSDGMPALDDVSLVLHLASPASPVDYQTPHRDDARGLGRHTPCLDSPEARSALPPRLDQ